MMNPKDIADAADLASRQSDRWLMIAVLIVFFIVAMVSIKFMTQYFMGIIAERQKAFDGMLSKYEEITKLVTSELTKSNITITESNEVIAHNSEVINQNTQASRENIRVIEDLRKKTGSLGIH